MGTELADMSEDEVLAFCGDAAERERRAAVDQLRGASQWAVIHDPDRLDPTASDKPGREQPRRYGGDGTPEVCEFAAAALGARMGITTHAAEQLMADALDLQHRGGTLWERVQTGEVRASYARFVVRKTRDLPREQALAVAEYVAESADGRIPWARFEKRVEAAVAKADPEAAAQKERKAREATFARKLRDESHGMASYLARGPVWMINQIAATVSANSAAIKELLPQLTDDERDLFALLMLLTPGASEDLGKLAEAAPLVVLYVHTYRGDLASPHEGINRLEGHGPVTDEWVRDVLGPHTRFQVKEVIDIEGMAPVDAYEIPDRHREAVRLMTPADVFPYGSNLDRDKQIDHTEAYDDDGPPGQSAIGNYGPLTTPHHRLKTHGGWQVKQPFPGIYIWRDTHGAYYLVDCSGTRQIPQAADATTQTKPRVVEIYRNLPDVRWGDVA
jgi:hypothetical protein